MLYLEDYLEMIEQLPMDLRDRFTEMREMDLQVQNAMDQLEQRVSEFFMNAKKNKPEWREEQMTSIKKDYYKALEDADEKVQLANQIYDLKPANWLSSLTPPDLATLALSVLSDPTSSSCASCSDCTPSFRANCSSPDTSVVEAGVMSRPDYRKSLRAGPSDSSLSSVHSVPCPGGPDRLLEASLGSHLPSLQVPPLAFHLTPRRCKNSSQSASAPFTDFLHLPRLPHRSSSSARPTAGSPCSSPAGLLNGPRSRFFCLGPPLVPPPSTRRSG
ncbi:inhibitor of growth protein 3 isoform X6 [Ornithorhynchus anatinus]|uniref:inhibitor of growth protein 3 isoform X6 n=1 Tax=Ornithorhynchus anatinus TaxID=9258 RepID=UPI0010A84B1E|nr:inhibitor of growth protein 3 isoform X6 [Ornithorhynchus anatinus]